MQRPQDASQAPVEVEPSGSLLLLSLGPVQDFIATARTCQDLWFGSWLLSDLSRTTARSLQEHGASALIFPHAGGGRDGELPAGVANKILAELPPGRDAAEVAKAAGEAMQERLRDLARTLFEKVGPAHFDRELAMAQVDELMELMWVAVPLPPGGYAQARQRCEAALAQRKNTRTWAAVPWPAQFGRPKSSLDGQRESVLDPKLFRPAKAGGAEGKRAAERLWGRYRVHPGEHLCGIGMLKRQGLALDDDDGGSASVGVRHPPPFHSTGHMAAAPLLTRLAARPELQREIDVYAKALAGLEIDPAGPALAPLRIRPGRKRTHARVTHPYDSQRWEEAARTFGSRPQGAKLDHRGLDGGMLFESRLPELLEELDVLDEQQRVCPEDLREAQRALRRTLQALEITEPYPYYGVLLADGDRMGRLLDAAAERGGQPAHRAISEALADFADEAVELVETHGGSLIYSGGDDVLALVPLHTALATARALAEDYAARLGAVTPEGLDRTTLSVGLAVCHFMHPMGEALDLARGAERLAKTERNALAVLVDKRSGGTLRACVRWDAPKPLDRQLNHWAEQLHRERLPDGIAFELEEIATTFEARGLREPERAPGREPSRGATGEAGRSAEVVLALTTRAISRKRPERGQDAFSEAEAAALRDAIAPAGGDPVAGVRALAETLQIARVFEQAYELAWGPSPAPESNTGGA